MLDSQKTLEKTQFLINLRVATLWEINEKNSGKSHFRFSYLGSKLARQVLTVKAVFRNQYPTFGPAFNLNKHCPSKISLWEETETEGRGFMVE